MARNKVMTLWTVVVTAFIALFTALGLVAPTAAAAVPQTEPARNSGSDETTGGKTGSSKAGTRGIGLRAQQAVSAMSRWALAYAKALPPTMKQRIRAEAHGKTPSCRHRSLTETEAATTATATATSTTTATADSTASATAVSAPAARSVPGPRVAPAAGPRCDSAESGRTVSPQRA